MMIRQDNKGRTGKYTSGDAPVTALFQSRKSPRLVNCSNRQGFEFSRWELEVTCWCEAEIVKVFTFMVKEGFTVSCGHPDCRRPRRRS